MSHINSLDSGLLLWNFLRKFLRRTSKVCVLAARSSQPPSSFTQTCLQLRSPSKALLGSLVSGLLLWNFLRKFLRRTSKVCVLAARSSQPPSSFTQTCLQLRSPSKALLGSLVSGTVSVLSARPHRSAVTDYTHLCLRLFLWARRASHQLHSGFNQMSHFFNLGFYIFFVIFI